MRQQFESVEVLEVIKGEDSDEATYDAARKLLQTKPNIVGVYNVAGGNRGLAQALAELQHVYRAPRDWWPVKSPWLRYTAPKKCLPDDRSESETIA